MATNALLHPHQPFCLCIVLISQLISFVLYNCSSIFPECLIPNHLPVPHRSLNSISLMAPQKTARSTSLWRTAKQIAESAYFNAESEFGKQVPKDSCLPSHWFQLWNQSLKSPLQCVLSREKSARFQRPRWVQVLYLLFLEVPVNFICGSLLDLIST